jgi:uncharacterized protein (UPF0333 family)
MNSPDVLWAGFRLEIALLCIVIVTIIVNAVIIFYNTKYNKRVGEPLSNLVNFAVAFNAGAVVAIAICSIIIGISRIFY